MRITTQRLLTLLIMLFLVASLKGEVLIDPPSRGKQYNTLYFRFVENLPFENPFDLLNNQLVLQIRQPDFSELTLSFFYNGLNADSVQQWEARFAPKLAGRYHFSVVIDGKRVEQLSVAVAANPASRQGGLTLAETPGIFRYESGEPFRALGINVCWAGDYEYYFKKMKAAGMTVTRLWMCPWNLSFEWQETGLGRYNLDTARRLDEILTLAEQYEIFVILCMDYHGIAQKGHGFFKENRWLDNPYNKINGGPCETGADLFTNAQAKELFKQKYKYLISRHGHSAQLATWEFYNEADLMAGKAIPVNRWHVEMGEFIKTTDVHRRMVSSSSTRNYPEKLVDAFNAPAMDYVMYHVYNSVNMAAHVIDLHELAVEYYRKPFILGEFGIEFRGADRTYQQDPEHIGVHNSIWAGWFSETPVIPLSWWWDNYIDPHNVWEKYRHLADFAGALEIKAGNLRFRTLPPGILSGQPAEQAACLVRSIESGGNCALWFKNLDYQWSVVGEGKELSAVGVFRQKVSGLPSGSYEISWYDPQKGVFLKNKSREKTSPDGELILTVPSFVRDLACLIKREGD